MSPNAPSPNPDRAERGATLIELMMALVLLAIGVLAVIQLFPAATRIQVKDRLMSASSNYAQEKVEDLSTKNWADADLAVGRHPAGTAVDSLGPRGTWVRYHEVEQLAAPLDNLRKVTVHVSWTQLGVSRQVLATTYVRR